MEKVTYKKDATVDCVGLLSATKQCIKQRAKRTEEIVAKTWVINVQVNTQYMKNLPGTGTWESPIEAENSWYNHVQIAAVSDHLADGIVVGDGDSLKLRVGKEDTIKWIVSEVNSFYDNYISVCMYGLYQEGKWGPKLRRPNSIVTKVGFTAMLNGFNAENEPQDQHLKCTVADISIPQTTLRTAATSKDSKYHIRFLLVNIEDPKNPIVMKYLEVTSSILFCLS